MAWTQAQIDALKSAIALGVTTVQHNGKSATYRSLDEMLRLLQRIEGDVSPSSEARTSYAQFSRGDD